MDRQYSTVRTVVVVGLWGLMGATHPLWVSRGEFPQIPFTSVLIAAPLWVDYVALLVLAVASFAVAFGRSRRVQTKYMIFSSLSLLGLVLLNQQRLQPWAYLTLVQLVILVAGDAAVAMRLLRIVFVSIYVYSAVNKFDYAFFLHLGQRFVDTFLSLIGMHPHLMTPHDKIWLIWLIPLGELVVGIGLALRTTRRFGVGLAVVLHAMLIGVLGPWGLDHHLGVLFWNVLFATQVVILFGTQPQRVDESPTENGRDLTQQIAIVVTIVCALLPLLEIFGPADHWPAWSLYSDRTDKVEVFVGSDKISNLPAPIAKHLGPQEPFSKWRRLYVEQWSLTELMAPIYPEDRFQTGVALAIGKRYELENGIKITIYGSPNRFTGVRTDREVDGIVALKELAASFWLNADARKP